MSLGVYVHWPYCARICPYCDFNVYRARAPDNGALLSAILSDMRAHGRRLGKRCADTLFFGGGTPSLLPAAAIAQVIECAQVELGLRADAEVTLEANPDERDRFDDFVAAGVNRLSIGVQALREARLRSLGRAHSAADAHAAVEAAARTRARVSLDLIYASPDQDLAAWREELIEALAAPAEHVSLYQLSIEEGTAFERAFKRGTLRTPDQECAAALFETTQDICDRFGMRAYEISNHARTREAQARHNLIYWRTGEWIGLGPGAHGRIVVDGARWATLAHAHPRTYVEAVAKRGVGWESSAPLGARDIALECLAMGLRLDEGLARTRVEAIVDTEKLAELAAGGLVRATPEIIALTARGRLVGDRIACELVRDAAQ